MVVPQVWVDSRRGARVALSCKSLKVRMFTCRILVSAFLHSEEGIKRAFDAGD